MSITLKYAKRATSLQVWPLKLKLELFRTLQSRAKIFLKWSLMRLKSTLIITVVNNESLLKLLCSTIADW